MGTHKFFLVAAIVLLVGVAGPTASAQTRTFDFVTDNNNGNYPLLPNGTVTVNLFLRETLSSASTGSLLVAENSLVSEGVRIRRTTSPSAPATITAVASDPYFGFSSDGQPSDSGFADGTYLSGLSFSQTGAPILTDSALVRRVRLGSVTLQGGLVPLQTSIFTLDDDPAFNDNFTGVDAATLLDPLLQPRTFTVSVLPEPASLGAVGLLLGGTLLRRRRRAV